VCSLALRQDVTANVHNRRAGDNRDTMIHSHTQQQLQQQMHLRYNSCLYQHYIETSVAQAIVQNKPTVIGA